MDGDIDPAGITAIQCKTYKLLAERFAKGSLSPQEVQRIAAAVTEDVDVALEHQTTFHDLTQLANIGNRGRASQRAHSDIMKRLSSRYGQIETTKIEVPISMHTGDNVRSATLPMLEPHCTLEHLYTKEIETFEKRILPSEDELEHFWDEMAEHPQLVGHPVTLRRDYKRRAIPLTLHGDGVPATGIGKGWGQMMDVFSFSSLLGFGSTVQMNMLIWIFFTSMQSAFADGRKTYDIFFEQLVNSLCRAWRGRSLITNEYCFGGFFFVLWVIKGDLDHLHKVHRLPNATSNRPCSWCPADSDAMSWNDFRPHAAWLHHIWSAASWRARYGDSVHSIFNCPGTSILTVAVDWMHIAYLGVYKYMYGSLMYVLCFFILPDSHIRNLEVVGAAIRRYQRLHLTRTKFRHIKRLTMFVRKSGYPCLRGKAAEVKHLGPALEHVFNLYKNEKLGAHRRISLMLKMVNKMERILSLHSTAYRIPEPDATAFTSAAFSAMQMQQQLHEQFADNSPPLFAVTAKSHHLVHGAIFAKYLHPARGWCFSGEDFMRHTQRIVRNCVAGRNAEQAMQTMMTHYDLFAKIVRSHE